MKAHADKETVEWGAFIDKRMAAFIREHMDAGYTSIFEQTSRAYYDDVRSRLARNIEARNADQQSGGVYSRALKLYADFLQSKYFQHPELPFEHIDKKRGKKKKTTVGKPTVPDEDPESEGARRHIELERPYRNSELRKRCIAHWGAQCQCCGMDFASLYGDELGKDYIEVHHLKPISSIEGEHEVDAVNDLVPLCANCHAMIHRGPEGPLTLGELRTRYRGNVWEITQKKED